MLHVYQWFGWWHDKQGVYGCGRRKSVLEKNKSDADRQHLQDDLNKLTEWSEKWQMLFNFGKCKCLHTGHGNEDAQYGGTVLNTTLKEKG